LRIKNIEDKECYKRANEIVKKEIKKKRNRVWGIKCREMDIMVGGSRLIDDAF